VPHNWADYVKSTDLVIGETYFVVQYLDHDGVSVPELRPVVFIGRNLDSHDRASTPKLYFQDAGSNYSGETFPDEWRGGEPEPESGSLEPSVSVTFETWEEREYSPVFEFERALDCLLAYSLKRRAKIGNANTPAT